MWTHLQEHLTVYGQDGHFLELLRNLCWSLVMKPVPLLLG